jgi:hypothetical protein
MAATSSQWMNSMGPRQHGLDGVLLTSFPGLEGQLERVPRSPSAPSGIASTAAPASRLHYRTGTSMSEMMKTAAGALATHFDHVVYETGSHILVVLDSRWFKVEVTESPAADGKEDE